MSRFKRFAHSLVSGYVLLGVNIIYALVQGRMVLHYISDNNEVGLWAVAIQVATYLLLLDLGMSGSIARILIDHKDKTESTAYGETIKTGFLVLCLQGALVVAGGALVSQWLPEGMILSSSTDLSAATSRTALATDQVALFRSLVLWQCVLIGVTFAGRMFGFILEAHQRYDVNNYAQAGAFVVTLLTLWWGFEHRLGLYSLLWSNVAGTIFVNLYLFIAVRSLGFLPAKGKWGSANPARFRELFGYATDVFLLAIGNMLITASQVVVVGWALGVGAAAVWTFTTKTFAMAHQLIGRIYNVSSSAFSEMVVRGEVERLRARFRDVMVLTAAVGTWVTMSVALCNNSFLKLWTSNRMSWSVENDFLMALYILIFTTTRCHVGLACVTKELRTMKFIYFAEGIAFVALAWLLGRWLGFVGIIFSGIVTNLALSGLYGIRRTSGMLRLPAGEILGNWMSAPLRFLAVMLALAIALRLGTAGLPAFANLPLNAVLTLTLGGFCLWKFGLPGHLRTELALALGKVRARLQKQTT